MMLFAYIFNSKINKKLACFSCDFMNAFLILLLSLDVQGVERVKLFLGYFFNQKAVFDTKNQFSRRVLKKSIIKR